MSLLASPARRQRPRLRDDQHSPHGAPSGGAHGSRAAGRAGCAAAAGGPAAEPERQFDSMVSDFKVTLCKVGKSAEKHDHRSCWFYHSERDRRRPVVPEPGGGGAGVVPYRAEPCPDQFDTTRRRCFRGDACLFCHSTAELLYHPDVFRKRLCHQAARCPRGCYCAFGHSREELLVPHFTEEEERNPSEDFIAHRFKTQWCPIGGPHDWENCVYAHTYRDWRRSPALGYSSRPCPHWQQSLERGPQAETRYSARCPRGMACPLAHGSKEQLYHPNFYKTSACNERDCRRGVFCAFTHGVADARRPTAEAEARENVAPIPRAEEILQRHQPTYMQPPKYHALDDLARWTSRGAGGGSAASSSGHARGARRGEGGGGARQWWGAATTGAWAAAQREEPGGGALHSWAVPDAGPRGWHAAVCEGAPWQQHAARAAPAWGADAPAWAAATQAGPLNPAAAAHDGYDMGLCTPYVEWQESAMVSQDGCPDGVGSPVYPWEAVHYGCMPMQCGYVHMPAPLPDADAQCLGAVRCGVDGFAVANLDSFAGEPPGGGAWSPGGAGGFAASMDGVTFVPYSPMSLPMGEQAAPPGSVKSKRRHSQRNGMQTPSSFGSETPSATGSPRTEAGEERSNNAAGSSTGSGDASAEDAARDAFAALAPLAAVSSAGQ